MLNLYINRIFELEKPQSQIRIKANQQELFKKGTSTPDKGTWYRMPAETN